MARLWQPNNSALKIWWLNACEETAFIADYDEVATRIQDRYTWKADFEQKYFWDNPAQGLLQPILNNINGVRRRCRLPPIEFIETDADDYVRDLDLDKAEKRRQIREQLAVMAPERRARLVDECRAKIQLLPPPHKSFAVRQNEARASSQLSEIEIGTRTKAVKNVRPNGLDIETAARMLKLTEEDPEVLEAVIGKLAANDLLELAERIEKREVRKAIIMRALGGGDGRS